MSLKQYRQKRDFKDTKEPKGSVVAGWGIFMLSKNTMPAPFPQLIKPHWTAA